jgi:hypothetical protein
MLCKYQLKTPAHYLEYRPVSLTETCIPWKEILMDQLQTFVSIKELGYLIHDYLGPPLRVILPKTVKREFWQKGNVSNLRSFVETHSVGSVGKFVNKDHFFMLVWKSVSKLFCSFAVVFFHVGQLSFKASKRSLFLPVPFPGKYAACAFQIRNEALCRTTDLSGVVDYCTILIPETISSSSNVMELIRIDDAKSKSLYDFEFSLGNCKTVGENVQIVCSDGYIYLT